MRYSAWCPLVWSRKGPQTETYKNANVQMSRIVAVVQVGENTFCSCLKGFLQYASQQTKGQEEVNQDEGILTNETSDDDSIDWNNANPNLKGVLLILFIFSAFCGQNRERLVVQQVQEKAEFHQESSWHFASNDTKYIHVSILKSHHDRLCYFALGRQRVQFTSRCGDTPRNTARRRDGHT